MNRFRAAYDTVLAKWPVPVEPVDVPGEFGTTHVNVCGPADGAPLVLLHAGGATSTVWFNNVGELARRHRVYAVDQMNDAGLSVPGSHRLRTRADLTAWLDGLLDGLGLDSIQLCAHSYGGWVALSYALHAPDRVGRLALLDPTLCFCGMNPSYRLHAVPLFVRPSAAAMRRFLRWETAGAPLDPDWLELTTLAAEVSRLRDVVMPRRPAPEQLRALRIPTLVLAAQNTRSHNPARLVANARRWLPDVTAAVLPHATHHTIPTLWADDINRALTRFLG